MPDNVVSTQPVDPRNQRDGDVKAVNAFRCGRPLTLKIEVMPGVKSTSGPSPTSRCSRMAPGPSSGGCRRRPCPRSPDRPDRNDCGERPLARHRRPGLRTGFQIRHTLAFVAGNPTKRLGIPCLSGDRDQQREDLPTNGCNSRAVPEPSAGTDFLRRAATPSWQPSADQPVGAARTRAQRLERALSMSVILCRIGWSSPLARASATVLPHAAGTVSAMDIPMARTSAGGRRTCVAKVAQWRERTSSNRYLPPILVAIFSLFGSKPRGSMLAMS